MIFHKFTCLSRTHGIVKESCMLCTQYVNERIKIDNGPRELGLKRIETIADGHCLIFIFNYLKLTNYIYIVRKKYRINRINKICQLEQIKYVSVCLSKQYITSTSKNISIKQHIKQ